MHSGQRIYPEIILEEDICLDDIAHHLAKICRYGGSLPLGTHYSVAQHCIQLVLHAKYNGYDTNVQRALLLHDASEAYLGDVVTDLKKLLPEYKKLETQLQRIIYNKYEIVTSHPINNTVKSLDTRILLDGVKFLFAYQYQHFSEQLPGTNPLGINSFYRELDGGIYSYHKFLATAQELGIKDVCYLPEVGGGNGTL
jgi:hypothetical protein